MLVPLPPLGYDPMLYFGSPAMVGRGGSMMMMGGGGGGGMMAQPPSYARMPPPMSFYGSGYSSYQQHHPAMGPMHAWGASNSSHTSYSAAGSPGSSVAPSVPTSAAATTTTTTTTDSEANDVNSNESAEKGSSSNVGGSSSDLFAQQMEASRVAFQKQLEIIREQIHKTHARVAATAQAAGYQNYTTLAATQEYIARQRKPQPLSYEEAVQTSGTKYVSEL